MRLPASQDSCGTACLMGDPALPLALQPKVLLVVPTSTSALDISHVTYAKSGTLRSAS